MKTESGVKQKEVYEEWKRVAKRKWETDQKSIGITRWWETVESVL